MRRILLENVAAGMKLAKPLYSADGKVLLNAGIELKDSYVARLKNLDVTYIYVEDEMTQGIEVPDVISEQARIQAVSSAKEILDKVRITKDVDAPHAKNISNMLVDELCANHGLLINFIDMHTRNDYLFTHAVNVCIYSIMTGIRRGYDELRLRDLGVGALLHDIGKIKIPVEILNNTDRLTAAELAEIRKHPDLGFDILRKNPDISLMSAHCAFQHHERLDGSGYPRGLKDQEIHEFAHIVAIADVYDALTSDVMYRRAVPAHEALAIIDKSKGHYFAADLVDCFTENIAIYPVGTVVRLNDNQIGVVVDFSRDNRAQPVVRIIMNADKRVVDTFQEIDLSTHPRLYIADVVER